MSHVKKILVWIQTLEQIPDLIPLLGKSQKYLENRYWEAWQRGRMCVFEVEVTLEQYERIKEWHLTHPDYSAYNSMG